MRGLLTELLIRKLVNDLIDLLVSNCGFEFQEGVLCDKSPERKEIDLCHPRPS